MVAILKRRIARIEARMAEFVAADPEMAALDRRLRTDPGVGPVAAATPIGLRCPRSASAIAAAIAALARKLLAPPNAMLAAGTDHRHKARLNTGAGNSRRRPCPVIPCSFQVRRPHQKPQPIRGRISRAAEARVEPALEVPVAPGRALARTLVAPRAGQALHIGLHQDPQHRLGEAPRDVAIVGHMARFDLRHPVVGHRTLSWLRLKSDNSTSAARPDGHPRPQ
jgi:hypothetical protein